MKKILFLSILFASAVITVQKKETCDSPKETIEDLNSITKCTIEPSKNNKSENQSKFL